MKKIMCFSLIAFFIIGCSREKSPLNAFVKEDFTIYLLADSALSAVDAAKQAIEALSLNDEPIISASDLAYYKWSTHSFTLKLLADARLRTCAKSRQSTFGIPFVVVVKDERIYLGGFWYSFSSYAPDFPTIDVTDYVLKEEKSITLTIEKSWLGDQPDKRNDPRVYQALKVAGVLIP